MAKERDADRKHNRRDDDEVGDDDGVSNSRRRKSVEKTDEISESEEDEAGGSRGRERRRSRKRESKSKPRARKRRSGDEDEEEDSYSSDSENSESDSDSESESEVRSGSESDESERRRRKRKERRRREKEREERERRRKRKEKKRKREKEEEKTRKEKKKMKKEKGSGNKGAVTNSWGKYGVIRETDMWNKRPEFTAWLQEVKQVNLESLPNWEEKQMFKEFMEDHNTATFTSKKYYDLDAYHRRKMEKEMKKGIKKVESERTVFNDEEQRRLELLREREKQKEEEVEALKRSMQGGLAQAMKEQARLKEEMAYQYKIGNFEAAAAIQRRLDPDLPM
uniref:Nucleic acid binding protein n=1 Tax=Kalanchoe fedtschenkoi TaxID=63787 RepID=A0A7N0SXV3_KALFE